MKKRLSISALISGLLAAPVIGGVPPAVRAEAGAAGGEVPIVESTASVGFPLEMPGDVRRQLRRAMAGKPLDAFGMQRLRRKMAGDALARVAGIRADMGRANMIMQEFPVQLVMPANGGGPGAVGGVSNAQSITILPAARTEKAAFLGISTSQASPLVRRQLNLPRGMGLVVDFVDKDSPAGAQDGLKVYDVLQKFDDQVLVNPQQLAVLVRAKNPGDSAAISVFRDGKLLTVTVKLAEKEVPLLEDLNSVNLNGQGMIQPGGVGGGGVGGGGAGKLIFPGSSDAGDAAGTAVQSSITVNSDSSTTRSLTDDQNVITITTNKEGKSTLVVKDRDGHTLYDGPEESATLSPELLTKVRGLELRPNGLTRLPQLGGMTVAGVNPQVTTMGPVVTSSINRRDEEHDITLRTDSGKRTLTIKDLHTGNTLFDGPANSDDDLKTLPEPLVKKVRAIMALGK